MSKIQTNFPNNPKKPSKSVSNQNQYQHDPAANINCIFKLKPKSQLNKNINLLISNQPIFSIYSKENVNYLEKSNFKNLSSINLRV
jgi:hypothetical protein